ncbi:MAG: hypothetical protein L0271_08445 [Gemmatimonadetes bacterium]|nr:hypothetical protein [Gemmatimonadota bacterium]
MIVRRYGQRIQSVTPNFNASAMTEIGFVRGNELSVPVEEFESTYRRVDERRLTAEAKGEVQGEVEEAVLIALREQLEALEAAAGGSVLLVENEPGVDLPKTRGRQNTIVRDGENRFVFEYTIDPPLRIGVWAPV